jgi:hypothetical protein
MIENIEKRDTILGGYKYPNAFVKKSQNIPHSYTHLQRSKNNIQYGLNPTNSRRDNGA